MSLSSQAYVPPADYFIGKWVNLRPQAKVLSLVLQIFPEQNESESWIEYWNLDFNERALERKWTQTEAESTRLIDLKGAIQFYVFGLFSPSVPTLRNLILSFDLGPKESDQSRLIRIHRQPLIAVGEGNEIYFEQDQNRFYGVRLGGQSLIRQNTSEWLVEVTTEAQSTSSFVMRMISGTRPALPLELSESIRLQKQRWDELVR